MTRNEALDVIDDVLLRCHRILRDTIRSEMCPAAWDSLGPEPYLADVGPVWQGNHPGHPLTHCVEKAMEATKRLRELG